MRVVILLFMFAVLALFNPVYVQAHGGGLDGSSGHNCNVGYCAGTYHYHYGGDTSTDYDNPEGYVEPAPTPQPVVTTTTEVENIVIVFETVEEKSSELFIGEREVKQKGVNGNTAVTYTITLTDGRQTNKSKSSEKTTKAPVDEIILVGTKEREPEPAPGESEPDVATASTDGPEEISDAGAVATLAVMGSLGYAGYKGYKKRKK